jgi:hypothetical protein
VVFVRLSELLFAYTNGKDLHISQDDYISVTFNDLFLTADRSCAKQEL